MTESLLVVIKNWIIPWGQGQGKVLAVLPGLSATLKNVGNSGSRPRDCALGAAATVRCTVESLALCLCAFSHRAPKPGVQALSDPASSGPLLTHRLINNCQLRTKPYKAVLGREVRGQTLAAGVVASQS